MIDNFAWESAGYFWTTQFNEKHNKHRDTLHQIAVSGGSIEHIINIVNYGDSDEANEQRSTNYQKAYDIFVKGMY